MSDDSAFLAAIQAAPRDDAPRLVYADWLDDNGRTAEARFIRLEHQLRHERMAAPDLPAGLDPLWAAQVFPEYRLILPMYPYEKTFGVVHHLWKTLGVGLVEARSMAAQTPCEIQAPVPLSKILTLYRQLKELGVTVEFRFSSD